MEYEYFLSKFASAEGKGGGEFYTPACLVRTMVECIEPFKGKVYDPACGSGGMFIQSAELVKSKQGDISKHNSTAAGADNSGNISKQAHEP